MKKCRKCLKEINENMMFCPYCGEKQDSDDFLSDLDDSLSDQIETKITLENEQEKFKLFDYEKVADDAYIIKGLKNKYVYKVDVPEGVVAICEEAFVNSKVIEVNLPSTLMEIEDKAFKNCKFLKKINIPEGVGIIGDEAFSNCSLLKIDCNKDNITIGNDVFVGTINEKLEKEELERKVKEEAEKKARAIEKENQNRFNKVKYEFNIEEFKKNKFFGRYPQTKVTDRNIINNLRNITEENEFGYIEFNYQEYKSHDGNYYLVEPIKWKILEEDNNQYTLVSDIILDQQVFCSTKDSRTVSRNTIYPNNYLYSNIRAWLNGLDGSQYKVKNHINKGFIDIAFNEKEKEMVVTSLVNNSANTTSNPNNEYACKNTNDKVYLLSYKDVESICFTNNNQRKTKVSDYAKEKGVDRDEIDMGSFWLRSPYYYGSINVDSVSDKGNMNCGSCTNSMIGARPALKIKID